jgi:hypothetical protein
LNGKWRAKPSNPCPLWVQNLSWQPGTPAPLAPIAQQICQNKNMEEAESVQVLLMLSWNMKLQ